MSAVAITERLHRGYIERYPAEAADHVAGLAAEDALAILAAQPPEVLAPLCNRLSPDVAAVVLPRLERPLMLAVLNRMDPGVVATVLAAIEAGARESVIGELDAGVRRDVRQLLSHTPGTAGALMDPRVLHLRRSMRVREAVGRLRAQRLSMRPVTARRVLLLVDDEGRLDGMVEVQDLALADPGDLLERFAQPVPGWVHATATREEIVEQMEAHHLSSLAVVDGDGRLIGVLRYDDLMAAAREDAMADIQTMFGVSRDEQALSSAGFAIRKRLPWLQINLATAFLAASVVGLFEETIARVTALAVLLPVVAGQSGNTGAQALAVVIRGLALREIRLSQWPAVVLKELRVGIVNGIAVALVTAIGVFLWSGSMGLMLIIGLSMVLSMVIAGAAGALIPIVLTVLGQDPAQSSSIILTTVTDVAGFFSFLGIATLLLGLV